MKKYFLLFVLLLAGCDGQPANNYEPKFSPGQKVQFSNGTVGTVISYSNLLGDEYNIIYFDKFGNRWRFD